MNRLFALVVIFAMCLSLCACTSVETPAEVTQPETEPAAGNMYLCTLVEVTDDEFNVFEVADSVHRKLFESSVFISEDRTKLVYTNQMGTYTADLETWYDGEMWYESVVTWQEMPTPYGEHVLTATTFIFDEARGLVRMNFALDGKEGNFYSGRYFIMNEFELE